MGFSSVRTGLIVWCGCAVGLASLGTSCQTGTGTDPDPAGQNLPSDSPLTVTCPQSIHRCTSKESAAVLLSAHVTTDAPPVTVTWTIGGNVVNVQTFPGDGPLDTNVTLTQTLALGTYDVVVAVQDAARGPVNCMTRVEVVRDEQAPQVTCSVANPQLSPPNHQLLNVGLTVSASDDCDLQPRIVVSVFSDEPANTQGDGNATIDAKDIGPSTLQLSSERSENGDGRVYLIIVTATDDVGRQSGTACTVTVPIDQSVQSITSVEAQAAAAFDTLIKTGQPPSNFVELTE